jgi:ubiquinone/menaquinone biosynthesis C-methylase UbiE
MISYRISHLAKGGDYDQALARDPLDAYTARRERELLLTLLPRLYPGGVQRSLDFACGTGRISQLLDGISAQPFAVDVSTTMLAEATRKCPRTTFFTQDITETPLPIEPVELVTAFRFFGNAEDQLRTAALHAIRRALTPGGYLVLNNHRNPWSVPALVLRAAGERVPLDLHYWKLKSLLRRAGFRIRRTYGLGGWLYRAKLLRPDILDSRWADLFEQVSRLKVAGPWCPDAVIVAQRME